MEILDQVIPMSEAAARLGRKPATLRWWAKEGRIHGRCLDGRIWIFSQAELDRVAKRLGGKAKIGA